MIYEPRHDKTNKMSVRPAKTQISPVWSESLLCAQWIAKDPRFLHADSEDSDQTGRIPRLIWVSAGRTLTLLVLSCRGSNVLCILLSAFPLWRISLVHLWPWAAQQSCLYFGVAVHLTLRNLSNNFITAGNAKKWNNYFQVHDVVWSHRQNRC